MLLVQDICLTWGKKERNSAYAKKRAEFPMAYLLDNFPDTFHGDVIVHHLNFCQRGTTFQNLWVNDTYRFQFYSSIQNLNLTNLLIQPDTESCEVTFFYDAHRSGQPIRQGHNKDYHNVDSLLYRHDILNETIFSLKRGQYGRVIWNERKIYDTGEWYYQLHVSNLLHYVGKMPEQDIFLIHRPDFEYKQLAVLY
ncbi:MAG: hypothetical protein HFG52_12795 [Lachnospiraceae bacterium]|nr:hypothetical protein [Lachnospiraceae bacterium]